MDLQPPSSSGSRGRDQELKSKRITRKKRRNYNTNVLNLIDTKYAMEFITSKGIENFQVMKEVPKVLQTEDKINHQLALKKHMIKTLVNPDKPIDLHTTKVKIDRFLNTRNFVKFARMMNPRSHYKRKYVILDTDNKSPDLSTDTKFVWQISPNLFRQTGSVNILGGIKNIVGLRTFPLAILTTRTVVPNDDPFPLRNWVDILFGDGATTSEPIPIEYQVEQKNTADLVLVSTDTFNENHAFTIRIHEFDSQAYVAKAGKKFHFILFPFLMNPVSIPAQDPYGDGTKVTPTAPYYELVTSGKGNGWFWFDHPFKKISTFSISIGDPFDDIPISTITRFVLPMELIYTD